MRSVVVKGSDFMPEVPKSIEMWRRGGVRLNQKRHIDMTEDEKAHVAKCNGTKNNHQCKNPTFRCTTCGNYGCAQIIPDKCTAQGFKSDKCLNCGSVGTMLPVMEDELARFMEEWDKEVQLAKNE